jgi:sugar phosphate isomerase/epimerase
MRVVSLDHLTVFELVPPELVQTASLAGFTHVGMRLNPAAPGERQHPMLGNAPMLRETLARMRDTGTRVFDVGVFRLRKETRVADFEPVLETAARLGATHAVVNGDEPDHEVLAELLARLCELGRAHGLTMNLEFTPWTGVRTLADAMKVVAAAGRPEARVLVDTIHLDRSGGKADDVAAMPPALIAYAQVCDAHGPRPQPQDFETMIYQARNERGFPGEGNLDLDAVIRALPPDVPLSLEAPTKKLAQTLSALERARRGRAAVASLLARLA